MEKYIDIIGFEGLYQISNFGNVKSIKLNKSKILKIGVNNRGYSQVSLSKNGISKTKAIHKLVAVAFLEHIPCGHKLVVNHKDFNKLNNNVNNLRYISHKENCCNTDRFIKDILIDDEDRKKKVQQLWVNNNKEIVLEKKREYYKNNKDKWNKPQNKVKVQCKSCGKEREIFEKSVRYNKTGNCSKCNAIINLPNNKT